MTYDAKPKRRGSFASLRVYVKRYHQLLLMLVPGIVILLLFKLIPIGGMVIALQDYSPFQGILQSKWVGLAHFQKILSDPYMVTLVRNTVLLAFYSILFNFPIPIIFSLFLNEVRSKSVKNSVQSLSFLPYFISSAVMVSILYMLVSPSVGLVNQMIIAMGGQSISFMSEPGWFRALYVFLQVWHDFGYAAVVYLASIMAIDQDLYEAADIDGANRWQKMFGITLPSISGTVVVMLIIRMGSIFSVDLDRILLMYNESVYETADVIQTYVYRMGFANLGFPNYSYGTAVNAIKSILAFVLVIATNKMAAKYSETRLF